MSYRAEQKCVCVCVWTCLSKKRRRELFAEVMLMHIICLRLNVHSAGSRSGCPGNQLLTGSVDLQRFQFSRYTFNNCEIIMLKLAEILVNGPAFNDQNMWSTGEARHVSCSEPAAERVHYDRMRSLTCCNLDFLCFKAMRPTNIYKLPRTVSKMIHIIPHCIRENNLFHFTWKQIR